MSKENNKQLERGVGGAGEESGGTTRPCQGYENESGLWAEQGRGRGHPHWRRPRVVAARCKGQCRDPQVQGQILRTVKMKALTAETQTGGNVSNNGDEPKSDASAPWWFEFASCLAVFACGGAHSLICHMAPTLFVELASSSATAATRDRPFVESAQQAAARATARW